MDILVASNALEKIKLLAKYGCTEESNLKERQIALLMIYELAEQVNEDQKNRAGQHADISGQSLAE